jgi:hypothetical protein
VRRSKISRLMSALGQKQTLQHVCRMSALSPKADIDRARQDVRFVPEADIHRQHMVRVTARWTAGSHQQRQFAQDFVECELREKRQGVLDHQPLLRCERL